MASGPSTRGRFLGRATVGIGAAIGGIAAVPVIGYAAAPVTQEADFRHVSLGPVARFRTGPGATVTAAPYVEDQTQPVTSAGLAYVRDTGRSSSDWLSPEAMFVVFSNRCMHVGCPVQAQTSGFGCPCHGGQYDPEGRRIAGPPVRPLDRFQWEVRGGDLWLVNRWSVLIEGERVHYFPVKSPGQPLELAGSTFAADLVYPADTYRSGPAPA
jgi:menaquinol-cytochrome c reductase iron-sulfur subunit